MMNRKITLTIAGVVAIIATVSGVYMYENMYSSVSVGQAQYSDTPFEYIVDAMNIIVVGTVVDKEIVLLQYDTVGEDENGVEYLLDSDRRPFQKITLRVDEYFRDTAGNFDPMMIFYERSTDGLGWDNNDRVMYYVPHPQTYNLGEQHFYTLEANSDHNGKYVTDGFYNKYEIIIDVNGTKYIQSGLKEMLNYPPMLYSDAVNSSKNIGSDYLTPEMIKKRDNYKP